MKFLLQIVAVAVLVPFLKGQSIDTSGNGMLKGAYRFRQVAVTNVDSNGNPTETTASSGVITFDGNGNYSVTGSYVDNTISSGSPQTLNVSGAYGIGANGAGYIANPLDPTDDTNTIYGAVAQGVFSGSDTENNGINCPGRSNPNCTENDVFIAIPAGAPPTNANFAAPYQVAMLDFTSGVSTAVKNALFKLSPNGSGAFGSIVINGQAANQNSSCTTAPCLSQLVSGATYKFNSDGSATLTLPTPSGVSSVNALFAGTRTMFLSADGNFVLGWNPSGFDIFFGVKAYTQQAPPNLVSGLFFIAGLQDTPTVTGSQCGDTLSTYGSIKGFGDSNGDAIVHQRSATSLCYASDYITDDVITINGDGTTPSDYLLNQYAFASNGMAFVGMGTPGQYGIIVGFQAPNFSGTGVYLNPVGVFNAASYAPITAGIAPGELLSLFGSGLSSTTQSMQGGQAFPTILGGVQVLIDQIPSPIYFVSPGQISAIVPYNISFSPSQPIDIQINNNGTLSNMVQVYSQDSAPGVFSQTEDGIGDAAALHAATGQLITPSDPAQPGEYISLFLTGLGTVTPGITDGALGPSSPLSYSELWNNQNLNAFFDDLTTGSLGNQGNIQFAGLAPGLAGLYQINVQVPATGLGAQDAIYVELSTDTADVVEIQVPLGSGSQARPQTKGRAAARAAVRRGRRRR